MKNLRSRSFIVVLFAVFFIFTLSAHSELFNRGTDSLGNRLIYDSDLNITWYDYIAPSGLWEDLNSWASNMTVSFGGTIYDDWRLSKCLAYDCIKSEMSHLYYVELNNSYGGPLTNKGPFINLDSFDIWTGSRYDCYSCYRAFGFSFANGKVLLTQTLPGQGRLFNGLAVRSGDVLQQQQPSAYKTVSDAGYPAIEWRMVWINSGNATAMRVRIIDPIPADTTYVAGSINCSALGSSTTNTCSYDPVNKRIVWEGNIGPDPGAANEFQANNEVIIRFQTNVPANVFEVENQGCANWDENGNGSINDEISAGQSPLCSDDPATGAPDDPTQWQSGTTPVIVPTVDEWGMLIFIVLAGLCSAYSIRKMKNIQ